MQLETETEVKARQHRRKSLGLHNASDEDVIMDLVERVASLEKRLKAVEAGTAHITSIQPFKG